MKDSGVEWIGQIPDNWQIDNIGSKYSERKSKVSDRVYQPLSVTMKGIVPQLDSAAKTDAHDDRKLVCVGDFAINSRSDRRGSCGISKYEGSVSLINTVLAPKEKMNPEYYDWLFHTTLFADEFYKWGHGIVDDLWTTNWSDMKKIKIPSPPLDEQKQIADYLNNKCAELDALYSNIEKEIETLENYRASLISEYVTNGVKANVEKKESGLEWIERIPADWQTSKIKYLFSSGKGLSITKDNLIEDEELPVLSYGQIHSKSNHGTSIEKELLRFVDNSYKNRFPQCQVYKYDFVFADTSEDYDGCGNCAYKRDDRILFGGYHVVILHSKIERDNRYLAYLFQTNAWRSQIRLNSFGIKVYSITQKVLMNSSVLLPPFEEQQAIADILDNKCSTIQNTIDSKKEQLTVLTKYKKSLIYEYVTGKKEVPTQ